MHRRSNEGDSLKANLCQAFEVITTLKCAATIPIKIESRLDDQVVIHGVRQCYIEWILEMC